LLLLFVIIVLYDVEVTDEKTLIKQVTVELVIYCVDELDDIEQMCLYSIVIVLLDEISVINLVNDDGDMLGIDQTENDDA
jgi:hypothetical protein